MSLLQELLELVEVRTPTGIEALTKNLGVKTNHYRQMKNLPTLRGVQRAEDELVRALEEPSEYDTGALARQKP